MTDTTDSSGGALTEEKLKAIIADHRIFLATNGAKGAKADLKGANLTGMKLKSAELAEADLAGAVMDLADLEWIFLSKADLSGTRIRQANLKGAFPDAGRPETGGFIGHGP